MSKLFVTLQFHVSSIFYVNVFLKVNKQKNIQKNLLFLVKNTFFLHLRKNIMVLIFDSNAIPFQLKYLRFVTDLDLIKLLKQIKKLCSLPAQLNLSYHLI